MKLSRLAVVPLLVALSLLSGVAHAAGLPNSVAVGFRTGAPGRLIGPLLAEPEIAHEDTIYVAWSTALDGSAGAATLDSIRSTGARPWLRAVFTTPAPLADNLDRFEAEVAELVRLVRTGGGALVVQAVWQPSSGEVVPADLAFLIKKAAVAVTGVAPDALVTAGPVTADPERVRELFGFEIAAYLDLVTLAPGEELGDSISVVHELDPGKPLVLDALPWPGSPLRAVAHAAEGFALGVAVVLFDAHTLGSSDLAPLKFMSRELRGDLVFDPFAADGAPDGVWAFVREDLGLRVVAVAPPSGAPLELDFSDPQLRSPDQCDLTTGRERPLFNSVRGPSGLEVRVEDPEDVVFLRLARAGADETAAYAGEIRVAGGRQMPVEEILRRLQAFEDDQARRLNHYEAHRTLHLRFQSLEGAFEATYSGRFFSRRGENSDWMWEDFSVGGVRWRSKKLPKVPLIQPEKVASLPVEIRLFKDYEYRLRGSDRIDGRECWVIDFKPVVMTTGRSLYRGTVWVDRELFARVRTRATQVGLEGSVLSNEETWFFSPVDRNGAPAPWSRTSFVLPSRISGQQTLSILSATLPVELETTLEKIRINSEGFDARREAAWASEATMLRDTDDGLRYLRTNDLGDRIVESELDSNRLFLVGGVLWDETLDYPIPLAGVNYLDLDFNNTGAQVDVFFAGVFVAAGIADPQLFGSRFNGGANLSGLFVKGTDELYRDGEVVPEEAVKRRAASADIFVGRPLARFLSFEASYRVRSEEFSRADETAAEFVLPVDTLTHTLKTNIQFNRSGYRLGLFADLNRRSDWAFWGLPDNDEYSPDQKDYQRWRVNFTKTWWFPKFRKITLTVEHLDGDDLDRFSGYDFGLLGDAAVAGYPSGLVSAQSADGLHLTAGVNYLDLIRFEFKADAVAANNRMTGLDRELLAGIGAGGTITLPWQLIMNFEVGVAVAGPGRGDIALRVFFLRLFPGG